MTEPVIKFDFEHVDVDLYIALRELTKDVSSGWESGDWGKPSAETVRMLTQANYALNQFELSRGPLPDWTIGWNYKRSLVPGAQLMTKDGRRMGNAHIVKTEFKGKGEIMDSIVYHCLTDAGSCFVLNGDELHSAFWVGEFISDPDRIIADFDRHGHFVEEPQ